MSKYIVYLETVASTSIEVDAEDKEAAIEAAYDHGMPNICAQCSGWGGSQNLDLNDAWEVESVTDADGNLIDGPA